MQCNLTFAIAADGSTVHVSEVERGAACGCTCPGCGKALVARKGTEVQYHFAHSDGEECKHGYRNSLYLALRRAAEELGKIRLPAYEKNRTLVPEGGGLHVLMPESVTPIDRVDFTRKGGDIITGLLIVRGKRQLIIRILTDFGENTRSQAQLKAVGISVLELDLTREDQFDMTAARACFTDLPDNIHWLYNAKAEKAWDDMTALCVRQPVQKKDNTLFTYSCPIAANRTGGTTCYVMDRCAQCQFFFGLYGYEQDRYVMCGRDRLVAEPADLRLTMTERREKYGVRF
ncbi:MAG: hypothetical protein E7554_05845 [Ruminococcaceae bacterium]|nr:hypothetical protein [Oscillospiraceae bacterium]